MGKERIGLVWSVVCQENMDVTKMCKERDRRSFLRGNRKIDNDSNNTDIINNNNNNNNDNNNNDNDNNDNNNNDHNDKSSTACMNTHVELLASCGRQCSRSLRVSRRQHTKAPTDFVLKKAPCARCSYSATLPPIVPRSACSNAETSNVSGPVPSSWKEWQIAAEEPTPSRG